MELVARIRSDFPTKFGIPRQSGLVKDLTATVVFEPKYRDPEALRGLEGFSHLWLIWEFSAARAGGLVAHGAARPGWGATSAMGVFATRSPFRPNPIGLSCVRLEGVDLQRRGRGRCLRVSGADLMDGTPHLRRQALPPLCRLPPRGQRGLHRPGGRGYLLEVDIPPELLERVPEDKRAALRGVLAQDPRPSYQRDPERVYGFTFAGLEVRFTVADGRLTVCDIQRKEVQ